MAIGHDMSHSFVSVIKDLLCRVPHCLWGGSMFHVFQTATHTVYGEGPCPTFLRPLPTPFVKQLPKLTCLPKGFVPHTPTCQPFYDQIRAHDTHSKHKGHAPGLQDMCYSHRTYHITEEMYRTSRLTMGNVL